MLPPPYTLWHLSYVAIGACLAPTVDGGRLAATLLAFFLAVGVGAHSLDELHDRPLGTSISGRWLVVMAAGSLTGAVVLGLVGMARVGAGSRCSSLPGSCWPWPTTWSCSEAGCTTTPRSRWRGGAFPLLTAYYTQTSRLSLPALVAAGAAYGLSSAQRHLSTPARTLRRRVESAVGTVTLKDGSRVPIDVPWLLTPLELALRAMAWSMVALAVALVLART